MIESGLCDVTISNADKTDRVKMNVLEGMLIINLYDFKKNMLDCVVLLKTTPVCKI